MEELLRYFIKETDRKFDEIREEMGSVNNKLDDLTKFKVEMLVSARATSMAISALFGAISLAITVAISLKAH